MADSSQGGQKLTLSERANERTDVRVELDKLEEMIASLKIQYEQYFTGILPLAPEKAHQEVKALVRRLKKAPFKNSQMNFRLKTLESRYQTFNNYWQRTLREREEGTYSKDVFKANLREQMLQEGIKAETRQGKAERHFEELFHAYKTAIETTVGKVQDLDYQKFRDNLVRSAKELKEKTGNKKISFSVVVTDGKVKLKASAK